MNPEVYYIDRLPVHIDPTEFALTAWPRSRSASDHDLPRSARQPAAPGRRAALRMTGTSAVRPTAARSSSSSVQEELRARRSDGADPARHRPRPSTSGEMLCIVGPSGAGKSTLLHLLGTLDLPSEGKICLRRRRRDRATRARKLADFRNRSIGFVFQFHHLLPEFTALENVMMPGRIRGERRARARAQRARACSTRSACASALTHRPGELSGGEQQRVALARALIMEPRAGARRRADRQPRHDDRQRDARAAVPAERRRTGRPSSWSRTAATWRSRCRASCTCAMATSRAT